MALPASSEDFGAQLPMRGRTVQPNHDARSWSDHVNLKSMPRLAQLVNNDDARSWAVRCCDSTRSASSGSSFRLSGMKQATHSRYPLNDQAAAPDSRREARARLDTGRWPISHHDRYVVDTGRCFPYFAKHSYCSICLPVCAYNHKEWAKDFDGFNTRLFPTVLMPEAPVAVDPQLPQPAHWYPRLKR
jgi:hypothetical protein